MTVKFKKIQYRKKTNDAVVAACFLAPSLVGFMIFFIIPFFAGLYYSFLDGPVGGAFVGLSNYVDLLSNKIFQRAAANTIIFSLRAVPLCMILSLLLAVALSKNFKGQSFFRTIFVTPLVVPVASVALVWRIIFDQNGSLNFIMNGLGFAAADWMKTDYAGIIIVIMYVWKNAGYNMILFLAGLANIPSQYYEAADIDGAGSVKKFFKITLPLFAPTAFFVFIMCLVNSFKVFRETYILAGAYPHESAYLLQHYMNNVFGSLDYQKLTSAAFIMAAAIIAIAMIFYKKSKSTEDYVRGE